MCWKTKENTPKVMAQRTLFIELTPDEQSVIDILSQTENIQLNVLSIQSNLPISKLAPLLFELEMKGIIRCMPGGLYRLI
jgi:DNA processing protein